MFVAVTRVEAKWHKVKARLHYVSVGKSAVLSVCFFFKTDLKLLTF